MKKIKNVAVLLLSVFFFACEKEDVVTKDQIQNTQAIEAKVNDAVPSDSYFLSMNIGKFILNGEDITKAYSLYEFEVSENKISATSGLFSAEGKWIRDPKGQSIAMWFDVTGLPEIAAQLFNNLNGDYWMVVDETPQYIYLESYNRGLDRKLLFEFVN